jgi:hypothetical protein
MVHIDFGYIRGEPQSGDENAPSTTFLCAVESQTKWVVAIPVPSKDKYGLKYVVQQLVNATAGYGDINLLIRTDQELASQQIAKTWQSSRAAMKLKSHIQLVAVGQHQGLLSERYIQTVRQTLCLMHGQNWRYRVYKFNTVHLGPAACRVAVESISACKWPCELRFERRYAGKLVPSGTTVFAKTLPGKPKGIAQFEKAIFLGKNEASDSFLVGTISGTRVARTVRRSVTPYQAESLMKGKGVPWNFQQESIGVKLRCQKSMPMLGTVPFVDEEAETVKKTGQEQISSEEEPPARTGQMHNIASVNWQVTWSDQQRASTDSWSTLRAT